MMKWIVFAGLLALSLGQTTRKVVLTQQDGDGRLIFKKGMELEDAESGQEFIDALAPVLNNGADSQFGLELNNDGFRFRAPSGRRDEALVCLSRSTDLGREDCWSASAGCDDACELCVHVQRCHDREGRQRCMAPIDCPCGVGAFVCEPANEGISFSQSMADDQVVLSQDTCTVGGFDLLGCNPGDDGCLVASPCTSDDMSCCHLQGFFLAPTVAPTTAEDDVTTAEEEVTDF